MNHRLTVMICSLLLALTLGLGIIVGNSGVAVAQTQAAWNSQYYINNFTSPISGASPVYPTLDLTFPGQPTDATGTVLAAVPADNFQAIYTSIQQFSAGTYRFNFLVDDAAIVTIDGFEVFNVTTASEQERTVGIILTAGPHNIQVRFQEFTQTARIRVTWTLESAAPGQPVTPGGPTVTPAPTVVPTRTPLPAIPPGALTATVIRASVLNIRDAPSTGGNRIGRILRGETYAIVGRDSNARWFLLQLGGYQGWAYGYYLAFNLNEFIAPVVSGNALLGLAGQADTGVRAQTQATMRLRAAPTVASAQIGRVTWGAFVPVVGRTADGFWYQIVWRGTVGWVYSEFLRVLEGNLANVPIRG
jgi:uncharacterized protein YraI